MESYARFLVRRAWLVLLAVALATVWIGHGIGKLRTEFNVESSLPANHPLVVIDKTIRRQFGGRNTIIALIVPRHGDVWQPEVLQIVQDATLAALRLEGIIAQNVVSLAAPSVRVVQDVDGRIEADLLMRDVPRTPEAIAALRAKVDADPQLRGMVVTPDQRGAVLVVDFWEDNGGVDLAQRVLRLADGFRDRPVDFYFAGEPIVALTDVEQSREMAMRIPITFLVIALMLLVSFRNLQGMLIPMLTAVLSTIWGLGLMGHTGLVIDAWNAATPILLIAIAAGHSAQMLKRYIEEVERLGDNRAAVVTSTATMGPVMIAAGGVAALGFAALALTGIPAIIGIGLACAYGIGSAVVLEMTFVPALRSLLPAPKVTGSAGGIAPRILAGLERAILDRGGRPVLIATAVALLVAAAGAAQIRTYGSTREYMARGSLPRLHLEEIERHFPGTVTMTMLYDGPPQSVTALDVLRHMEGLSTELQRDPLVWRTASLVDLIKILHRTFNPDDPDPYRLPDSQGAGVAARLSRQLAGLRALHRPRVHEVAARRLPARRRLGARRAAGRTRAGVGGGESPARGRPGAHRRRRRADGARRQRAHHAHQGAQHPPRLAGHLRGVVDRPALAAQRPVRDHADRRDRRCCCSVCSAGPASDSTWARRRSSRSPPASAPTTPSTFSTACARSAPARGTTPRRCTSRCIPPVAPCSSSPPASAPASRSWACSPTSSACACSAPSCRWRWRSPAWPRCRSCRCWCCAPVPHSSSVSTRCQRPRRARRRREVAAHRRRAKGSAQTLSAPKVAPLGT